jgi:serine O-acetyltransferase
MTTKNQDKTRAEDWSRESKSLFEWSPGRSLLKAIRLYQKHNGAGLIHLFIRKLAVIRYRFWSVISGADIPINTRIEGGLLLPHPNGVVIHPDVRIGPNCLIFQQVTIGTRGEEAAPVIGAQVDVGAGAKILGNVEIGDHACIGANAVVISDIPAHATAVGVPAKIVMNQ